MNLIKIKNLKLKINSGMSLVEILVVVGIFAILGVLTTRAIVLTLSGSKKTENIIKIRENLNYSLAVIERQLRNADSILPADCTNADTSRINYYDQNSIATSFSCENIGPGSVGYIASDSAQLTDSTVDVTSCSFTCQVGTNGSPSWVKVDVEAMDSAGPGVSNAVVTASTTVSLRNY